MLDESLGQSETRNTFFTGESYRISLDVFEGPLDLLLHLVKKHELEIFDIPISFITEKYLEYLDVMDALNLDVAGEYLLMAATLAWIKSRELLPHTPGHGRNADAGEEGDEESSLETAEDPRQELIRRLLDYQKYKVAAEHLAQRPVVGRNVWTRGLSQEDTLAENINPNAQAPLAPFPVVKLIEALDRILAGAKVKFTHDVIVDRLSVSQCILGLTERLETEGKFSFRSCFRFLTEAMTAEAIRHEAVVTFLAVLEMAKLGMLALSQPDADLGIDDDIIISRAGADLRESMEKAVQELEQEISLG